MFRIRVVRSGDPHILKSMEAEQRSPLAHSRLCTTIIIGLLFVLPDNIAQEIALFVHCLGIFQFHFLTGFQLQLKRHIADNIFSRVDQQFSVRCPADFRCDRAQNPHRLDGLKFQLFIPIIPKNNRLPVTVVISCFQPSVPLFARIIGFSHDQIRKFPRALIPFHRFVGSDRPAASVFFGKVKLEQKRTFFSILLSDADCTDFSGIPAVCQNDADHIFPAV